MNKYSIVKLKSNTIATNTAWSILGKIMAMLFLGLLDITAARILSVESYAEWVFFFSVLTMLFYIGWMGINTSSKVYISKCVNAYERNNCIYAALRLRILVSIVIGIIIFIVVPLFSQYLGYPNKYPELKLLLKMAAAIVILNSFTEFFKELCIGLEKFKTLFLLTALEYISYFVFSAIMLVLFHAVRSIAFGYMLGGVCILFWDVKILRKDFHFQKCNTDEKYHDYIKLILKYAIPIAVISFGGLILLEMDTFMLGLLSTKVEVATYSIAKSWCSKATHINYALTVGTMTGFSVITTDNIVQKKIEFKKINKVNVLITAIISMAMTLLGPIAIIILYGNEYQASGFVMRLLVPYYALYSIENFYSSFLDFRGKAIYRSACYISIIAINLALNYAWIPYYGAKGAAMATNLSLVPYTILVTVAAFREFRKK